MGSARWDARSVSQAIETIAGGPQLSPELAVNPVAASTVHHENTVVAAGDGLYLVVWREMSNTNNGDILALRVRASDGAWLDPNPIVVATGIQSQWQPAVASDGTSFLVVWTDAQNTPVILGARVRASDGAVLDTPALYISRTPMGPYQLPQFAPAVAFDGTNYLVTWHGNYYAGGPVFYGVQGIRVRASDGTCIESSSIIIARDGDNSRVAYADGTYLVTWQKSQNVEAARISASTGQLLDAAPIAVAATTANERSPAVAGRSGEFLVTWIGVDNGLWARRVRASDGVRLGTVDIAVGPAAMAPPEVTFDGMDYRISWQGARGTARKALVTRVSSLGTVPPDAELVLADVPSAAQPLRGGIVAVGPGLFLTTYTSYDTGLQKNRGRMRLVTDRRAEVFPELPANPHVTADTVHLGTAVAAGNGLYLVVWSESGPMTGNRPDIVGVRVRASDGALLDASPLRIGTRAASADLEPVVAFDGTNFLVVWQDIESLPRITGARVRASDGAVLDPTSILISRTYTGPYPLSQTNPSVASDGTNFLVTWTGGVYENQQVYFGIRGIRVRSSDGATVESSSFTIARGGGSSRVAYTDGNYLVAFDGGGIVGATRVSAATGQVLDTTPISIAPVSANARTPAVASRSGEFLVTWIGGNGLWARRVRASDGVKLGLADILVGTAAAAPPEATFDGSDYRIGWQTHRGGVRAVLNTRVSSQGGMAGDAELVLAELHPSTAVYRPGIAAMSPGHFLTAYSQYDPQVRWGRTMMRLVSQEWVPAPCDSGEPSLALNGSALLTLECGPGLYSDPGARALDGCGNPIPVHAFNTGTDDSGPGPAMGAEGSYSVSYAAWDAMGHTVNAIRTVTVDDTLAPTLTLRGAAYMTHTCGSQWVDPGVEARDACYGEVSPQVVRVGDVNGWVPGTYTVTYTLRDPGGNSATPVTRTVDVANCPW
jgi:hypothetical protein